MSIEPKKSNAPDKYQMSISNLVVKTKGPSHEGNKLHTKTLDALSSIDGSGWQEMPRDDKLEQCQMSKLSTTELNQFEKCSHHGDMFFIIDCRVDDGSRY